MTFIITSLLLLTTSACGQGQRSVQTIDSLLQLQAQLFDQYAQDAHRQLGLLVADNHDSLETDPLVYSYYREGRPWVWMNDGRLLNDAYSLVSYLRQQVPAMGFAPNVFLLDSISHDLDSLQVNMLDSITQPAALLARLELNLSKMYLRYAAGQHFGFTDPYRLFTRHNFDIALQQADSMFVEQALTQVDAGRALEHLRTLEPTDSIYYLLRDSMQADSTDTGRQRLLVNMERRRWRATDTIADGQRHVFVNIASQNLWAIGPDSVQQMRICCGKPATKTPLLHSKINKVEVNPEWGIPMSIIRGEVSGHAGDSAYFARHNYYVTNRSGQRVDPATLTRQQMASGQYSVRQRSGAGNSLGRLIFRFPNKFSVYLHDTNSRSAFNRDRRTISHGCVRVQHPFDMARFVLADADDWMLDRIRLSIDYKPVTERGKQYKREHAGQAIRLVSNAPVDPQVPVHIEYYTLFPNPKTGKMETWGDPYSYDPLILKAIKPFMP